MDDLQHAGVKGMRWGTRKSPQGSSLSITTQAAHVLRREAGFVAARIILQRYGHQTLPVTKTAVKGAVGLLRYSGRVARGTGTALRILGITTRTTGRFGRSYVKGAVKIATMVR